MSHQPRKRFGQHFLADDSVLADIVRAIAPRPGQAMVEIGPGLGALTAPLLAQCPRLTVIELDRDLATRLRRWPGLEVVEADVLRVDFGALAAKTSTSCSSRRSSTGWRRHRDARTTAGFR
jgi:16S rRNA (adenine1518-N6/adenine1519-N6)-dimethyltransferase